MTVENTTDRLPYPVWTCDGSGKPNYVNLAWAALTGITAADFEEASAWRTLLAERESDAFIEALHTATTTGRSFRRDASLRHQGNSGAYRRHAIHIDPSRDAEGVVTGWTGSAIDVDDRNRAEDALEAHESQRRADLESSTVFQRAALPPRLPTVPGLSFDALYEPGRSDIQVGGDWYDAVRLLDGRVVVSIGDVSGHGVDAAVIMSVVRQILRGIAQLHAEPVMMLDAADRALRLEYPDVLVTAWVGIFDLVERTLTFASAGHPPPLLLLRSGEVRELDHLTLPIGLRQGHQGHATTVDLSHGATVWLYTDGLIEASRDIVEGTQRLLDTARHLATASVLHPAATIRRLVIPHGSADDVAILVVGVDLNDAERRLERSSFDSGDACAARDARRAFAKSLPHTKFSPTDVANAEIVFGELCGNVARYAPGRIDVVVDSSGVQTVLHVLDRGAGFQHFSRLPHDPLAENGRGLFIIASMTTEFTVSQRPGGGSVARAVLVGRYPISLLRDETLPAVSDQVAEAF